LDFFEDLLGDPRSDTEEGGHYVHFRGMFWGFVELTAASKAYLLLAAQLK
jgi:hypothetical protein